MYVTTQRSNSVQHWQRTTSWRTGRRFPQEEERGVATNPPIRRTGENLGTFLKRRNDYYARVAENLRSQGRYKGHVLTSDGGHSFHTISVVTRSGPYLREPLPGKVGNTVTGSCVPRIGVLRSEFDELTKSLPGKPRVDEVTGYQPVLSQHSAVVSDKTRQDVTLAIANMVPDASEYGFGETIVELLSGNIPRMIPDLIKRAKEGAKLDPKATGRSLGNDYLNARFGIEPILQDVAKVIQNLCNAHEVLYDNYKRKRHTQPIRVTNPSQGVVIALNDGTVNGGSALLKNAGSDQGWLTQDVRISAKYTKAVPKRTAEGFYADAQAFLRRIGFNERLTWDLIPWSWLIDWSGNIGASIENASAFNQYNGRFATAYCWQTRKFTATSETAAFRNTLWPGTSSTAIESGLSGSVYIRALQRSPVSPFGLNWTMPQLSLYQWSILVSLGLARAL